MTPERDPLVSPAWLAERMPEAVALDASLHMPDTGRNADAEFLAERIPGAQRFDINVVADPSSPLPHTMPSPERFAELVGAMGISNDTVVVVYEAGAPFSAPRAWWMFLAMGFDVKLLDGGLARWKAEGFPLMSGPPSTPPKKTFVPAPNPTLIADADRIAAHLSAGGTVADARSPERFEGRAEEPRPGIRAGHMPGAANVHYAALVGPDGRLKDDAALAAAFTSAGVDTANPVLTSCGSGVTAAILSLALTRLGTDTAVYDGSWTEWGGDHARPIATGPASQA